MKVLFKMSDYTEEELSVQKALTELIETTRMSCPQFEDREFLYEHRNDMLLDVLENASGKTLAGSYLSDLAAYVLRNEDDGSIRGFSSDDIEVRPIATNEFIWGAHEPEKLKEFAQKLKLSAKEDALFLLKNADVLGRTIDEQMLEHPVNEMGNISQAFAIMANEPVITMYAGIFSDWDFGGYMKCWPDDTELSKILANPRDYAVAEVVFK